MNSAFVAGATGYTGRAVVAELRRRGWNVVAHVRPDSPRLAEWRERFEGLGARVDTTPWQQDALHETLGQVRPAAVFALLGTTRRRAARAERSGEDASYEAVDLGLTMMLLRAAREAASDARFVYLSSLGASTTTGNRYLRARGLVETALGESGLEHVVARPSFVTGPDREESRPAERGAAMIADALLGAAARLGARGLRARYASVTGDELARALVELASGRGVPHGIVETGELRNAARRNYGQTA
jgi:nucleoside-diphosphate-sugar epimerase